MTRACSLTCSLSLSRGATAVALEVTSHISLSAANKKVQLHDNSFGAALDHVHQEVDSPLEREHTHTTTFSSFRLETNTYSMSSASSAANTKRHHCQPRCEEDISQDKPHAGSYSSRTKERRRQSSTRCQLGRLLSAGREARGRAQG